MIDNLLNTIAHMDAVKFLQQLPDDSVDMGITSPPYDNLRTYDGHSEFDFETIAHEAYRVLKPGGVLVWVVGDATVNGSETLTSIRQALYFVDVVGFKMHDTMIYNKDSSPFPDKTRYYQTWEYMFVLSKGSPFVANLQRTKTIKVGRKHTAGEGYRKPNGDMVEKKYALGHERKVINNVWNIKHGYNKTTKDKEAYAHPAMFPEKLAERHILTWSNPGDLVMDFFMGSGTTAKMARKNGRNYIGCDLNADYVDLARARLAKPFTPDMFIDAHADDEKPEQTEMEL